MTTEDPELKGRAKKDDPVFEAMLRHMLIPYIEAARQWWSEMEHKTFAYSVCLEIENGPPGFFEKCARSPTHSAIFGVQAFPCVACSYLQFPGPVAGGAMRLIDHLLNHQMIYDEFTLVLKRGLHSTMGTARFICIVPTTVLQSISPARWVYLRPEEILELVNGVVTADLQERLLPYAREYKGEVNRGGWANKTRDIPQKQKEHAPFG